MVNSVRFFSLFTLAVGALAVAVEDINLIERSFDTTDAGTLKARFLSGGMSKLEARTYCKRTNDGDCPPEYYTTYNITTPTPYTTPPTYYSPSPTPYTSSSSSTYVSFIFLLLLPLPSRPLASLASISHLQVLPTYYY